MNEDKIKEIIEIKDDLHDATNDNNVIYYWHEKFQLTKENGKILFNQNG